MSAYRGAVWGRNVSYYPPFTKKPTQEIRCTKHCRSLTAKAFHLSQQMFFGINRTAERVLKKRVPCALLTLRCNTTPHEPVFTVSPLSPSVVDGVFGRCQELAGADLYTYDISSSALQRLRILLQKLAHRGTNFVWESIFAFVIYRWVTQRMPFCVRQAKSAKLSLWQAQHTATELERVIWLISAHCLAVHA